jgi:hypothetical protein
MKSPLSYDVWQGFDPPLEADGYLHIGKSISHPARKGSEVMRELSALVISGLLALAAARPAAAGDALQLQDLVRMKDGAHGCWARRYDRAHLVRHPEQTVTEMRLALGYYVLDPQAPGEYLFSVSVQRRGEASAAWEGGSCWDTEGGVACSVDCDGGGFLLRRARVQWAVLLDMSYLGRLRLTECGEEEGEEPRPPELVPGKDDRVFLLYSRPDAECAMPGQE